MNLFPKFYSLFCGLTLLCCNQAFAQGPSTSAQGLATALQAVINNNPAVKGKMAEVEAQGFTVDVSRASRYPTLSVTANNISDQLDDQGTVRIDQPVYSFGKISASIREAEAGFSVELWDLLRVQRQLVEQTAVAYVEAQGALNRSRVAEQNIEEHDELYQRINRREQGQLASEADVTLANSRLIQSRALLERIKGEYRVALAELRSLTIVNVSAGQTVSPTLANLPAESFLLQSAIASSADIGLRRREVEQVQSSLEREKVDYLPTVYLRGEYDFLDQRLNADPERIGIAIEGDLDGFGFASRGRVEGAAARLNASERQLEVSEQEIRRQVTVLVANLETQSNLIESQRDTIEAVQATLESFIRQYETGRKSWVDVLNTQRELTNLRFELVNFEKDRMAYALQLQSLTGGLDEMAGIQRP